MGEAATIVWGLAGGFALYLLYLALKNKGE
jgi:hypothetical protein